MALKPTFTLEQSADCITLTLKETTGLYDATTNDGGYGTPNPAESTIINTNFVFTLPDDSVINLSNGVTPDTGGVSSVDFTAAQLGYTAPPSGVYNIEYELFSIANSAVVTDGTRYIVTGGGSITYNGQTYFSNQTFTATSVSSFTINGSCTVNPLAHTKNCNFLIFCGVQSCLKQLLLERCNEPCDCRDDFHAAMNELVIDFNAAQLAFSAGNYKCANDTMQRIEKNCGGICDDCGC